MEAIIDKFLKDSSTTEVHCSEDLSTYERMILHDLAEKMGLGNKTNYYFKEMFFYPFQKWKQRVPKEK